MCGYLAEVGFPSERFISRAEAKARIGRARFVADWGDLREGDRDLLNRYGPGGISIPEMPGPLRFIEAIDEQERCKFPLALRADLETARYRCAQHAFADEWLDRRGFGAERVECDAFERAFAAAFPETLPKAPAFDGQDPKPRRRRPGTERAEKTLRELYPDGVPNQSVVPNKKLVKAVSDRLKELGRPGVSRDTVLRAAKRRK